MLFAVLVLDDDDAVHAAYLRDAHGARGDWPVFSEVVEYRRAVVVDLYDADAPSDVSFAQWLRAFEDQGAIGVGYRVPVRIPRRMTQQLGQTFRKFVRDGVLETVTLNVFLLYQTFFG